MGEQGKDPEPVELRGPIADLALRYGLDGEDLPPFELARLVRGTWADVEFDGFEGDLAISGSRVLLKLRARESPSDVDMMAFRKLRGLTEWPITLTLQGGATLEADSGHLRSWEAAFG